MLGILGSYLWGVLDQKAGTKKAVIVFALYMAIMQFLLAAFIGSKTVTLILIILLGILIGGICNLLPSMVIQIFGRYEFAAANSVVTPIVVAIRTSTFIIMPVILTATQGSYQVLSIVLGVLSLIAFFLALGLSNKTLEAPKGLLKLLLHSIFSVPRTAHFPGGIEHCSGGDFMVQNIMQP